MEQNENENKIAKESGLYCDIQGFKGFSFQKNIDSINKLYFGQGLAISAIPYIYKNESDGKYYMSAYCFSIIPSNENGTKEIYYPENFLNLVFYHNNLIFFVNIKNELCIYKLDKTSYIKYNFTPKYLNKNKKIEGISELIKKETLEIKEDKLKEISDKLAIIEKDSNLKSAYEILCGILKNDFGEKLMKNQKQLNSKVYYIIDNSNLKFTCELWRSSNEIDSIGHLREPINVIEGEVSFKIGIETLNLYVELKEKNNAMAKNLIENDFKSPILYKNFKDKIIPKNMAIICEIKGGFAIEDVTKQITNRINFAKNCLFNKGEKPSFFIGIINFNSENIKKLSKYCEYELNFDENVLIISIVDNQYHGLDVSYEINSEYLLFKKLNNLDNKLDRIEKDIKKELHNYFEKLDSKFTRLLNEMAKFHPNLNTLNQKIYFVSLYF